jgi:hypothetical protein
MILWEAVTASSTARVAILAPAGAALAKKRLTGGSASETSWFWTPTEWGFGARDYHGRDASVGVPDFLIWPQWGDGILDTH